MNRPEPCLIIYKRTGTPNVSIVRRRTISSYAHEEANQRKRAKLAEVCTNRYYFFFLSLERPLRAGKQSATSSRNVNKQTASASNTRPKFMDSDVQNGDFAERLMSRLQSRPAKAIVRTRAPAHWHVLTWSSVLPA